MRGSLKPNTFIQVLQLIFDRLNKDVTCYYKV
jgi:hypothetical protein